MAQPRSRQKPPYPWYDAYISVLFETETDFLGPLSQPGVTEITATSVGWRYAGDTHEACHLRGRPTSARRTKMSPCPLLKSVRVVVVDDCRDFRDLVISSVHNQPKLQLVGEACNGEQAVRTIEALRPDLVLLDLGLPILNGFEVTRIIRKTSPKSKIVFVSLESSPDVVQEALSLGACGYVLKSDITNGVLGEAMSAVIQGRHFLSETVAGGRPN